MIKYK